MEKNNPDWVTKILNIKKPEDKKKKGEKDEQNKEVEDNL